MSCVLQDVSISMKVIIDCYNQKLGEITFPNRPADFSKLVTKVKKCNTDGKEVVYGLEDARDMVTLSIVSDLQHYDSQLAEVDRMLEQMYKMLGCTLTTIPGVSIITAVKILSEICNIKRFANANKLAQFAGIAPLHLSSSGKGKDMATKQGNRRLQATIYFLAVQMVQVSSKGTPRNPVVRAYYEKRKAEGKTSQQALICISRRLISIIYGMLKNGTEYRMPVLENAGENR